MDDEEYFNYLKFMNALWLIFWNTFVTIIYWTSVRVLFELVYTFRILIYKYVFVHNTYYVLKFMEINKFELLISQINSWYFWLQNNIAVF